MPSRRPLAALLALALGAALPVVVPAAPAGATATERWIRAVSGGWFAWSSPALGDVNGDGINELVIGGLDRGVYVYTPDNVLLWRGTAMAAVASSPAVGDVDSDGSNEVVVGTGSLETDSDRGGISIFNANGTLRCNRETRPGKSGRAVFNAPAIGDVDGDGRNDIVYGSFDHLIYVVGGDCGVKATFDNTDSVWSAPALYDVDGDGASEIFIGGDATASLLGLAHSGGYFRSLAWGGGGTLTQRWVRAEPETFQSATAIGDVNGDGRPEAVTGSGVDYCRNQQPGNTTRCNASRQVWAFDLETGATVSGWPKAATYSTFLSAPALGDINGDGSVDVVVGSTHYNASTRNPEKGAVDAFLGAGKGSWRFEQDDEVVASPVIADIDGSGPPEVVISLASRVFVLNGVNGALVQQPGQALAYGFAHKSAVAVGEFGAGRFALASTGFDPASRTGTIHVYDLNPKPTSIPWGQYRKNARRLGADAFDQVVDCDTGYWMVGGDGGVFSFGSPFFGSTGALKLNRPVVGMAAAKLRDGYWFVASDGGIFNYGPGARFFGSTGAMQLNQPIVGMAVTPSGNGYWLVASDGGIFNYGDAGFHGSTGALKLNSPVVGMAATPSGNGYWLVAADGGIFNYGDAGFHGSTGALKLNSKIVGMAATKSGNGYWFVAADGGIFNYGDAGFYGSAGAARVPSPIVAIRRTPTGAGYWFATAAGRIYRYGDADYCGALGSAPNSPVVGLA